MKTGIEIITEERERQINEKGYDAAFVAAHPEYYDAGQLEQAAVFTLRGFSVALPMNWPDADILRLQRREGIEALKVAGAFCAAEIDRLQSL